MKHTTIDKVAVFAAAADGTFIGWRGDRRVRIEMNGKADALRRILDAHAHKAVRDSGLDIDLELPTVRVRPEDLTEL